MKRVALNRMTDTQRLVFQRVINQLMSSTFFVMVNLTIAINKSCNFHICLKLLICTQKMNGATVGRPSIS